MGAVVSTLPALVIGLQGLSTVIGAFSQFRAGQVASDASKFQARVARNNAILAERAAEDAKQLGA
ncbi:MAG: hypothetical protein L0Y56_00710, partial [Nitrospira sp.]|nr:hypothetical protein [Nitrospira sp.]